MNINNNYEPVIKLRVLQEAREKKNHEAGQKRIINILPIKSNYFLVTLIGLKGRKYSPFN